MSKPTTKYSPMSKSRSVSRDDPNAESLMELNEQSDNKMSITQIRHPKDLFKWFMQDPLSRWQLIFFLGIFVLSLILLIISLVDTSSSYVTSGIAGIVVAGYGFFHFRTLMALKEEVDTFERHNQRFKQENAALRVQLNKLENTRQELQETSVSLDETTKKNKENLDKFEKISHNLEIMGNQNMEGVGRIADMTKVIASKWRQELVKQERELYMNVYEQLEMKDNNEEMTRDEYESFLDALPAKYRMRLQHQSTFENLAGSDDKLNYKEFSNVLDKMARDFAKTPRMQKSSNSNNNVGDAVLGGGASNTSINGIVEED